MPITTTRPLQASKISTARSKLSSSRSMQLGERLGFDAQHASRGIQAHCTLQPRTSAAICVSFPSSAGNSVERQGIRSVRKRLRGIFVHFQKNSVHAHGGSRARQRLDKLRLPAAGFSRAARQLHGMRHVKNHRAAGLAHDRKRTHVDHQILIAEGSAAFGQKNACRCPVSATFSTALAISHGERNCPFFRFTTRPVFPAATSRSVCRERNAGICSTSATSATGAACEGFVNVGQNGNAETVFDFLQDAQAFGKPRPAIRVSGRAIGLVIGSLENKGHAARPQ